MFFKKNLKIKLLIIFSIIFFGLVGSIIKAESFKEKKDVELRKKIGQMLIVGFRDLEINSDSYIVKTVNDLNLGGVILFDKDNPSQGELSRNIANPQQTKKLISDLKNFSSSHLFVSLDAEGGYVNRLKEKYGFFKIPSAENLGQGSLANTSEKADLLGMELASLGFNMNFAPVVDVNINPNNPVIGYLERSFSADPQKVYSFSNEFIKALQKNKIITAIKHFPGHGSSTTDSHLGLVDITKTWTPKELIPYLLLIKNGYSDMIMTAHIMNTEIDPDYPATLSPIFLNLLLRKGLGFKGLIISDDMQMGAIADNFGFEEALVRAINAGCDVLILSNNIKTYDEQAPYKAVNAIFKAIQNNQISEERINESYNRIQEFKNNHGI